MRIGERLGFAASVTSHFLSRTLRVERRREHRTGGERDRQSG
jgi:hypothetical protein